MKIVFVISSYYPRWGGAENQVRKQSAELARRGHMVEVVTWWRDLDYPRVEEHEGTVIRRVPRTRGGPWAELVNLARMAGILVRAATDADILVAHQLLPISYLAAAAGVTTRTPMVAKAANTASAPDSELRAMCGAGLRAALHRLVSIPLRHGAIGVAMSDEIAHDLNRLGFRQIARIPNGVSDPGLHDKLSFRQALYAPLGIPADARVVAGAGRLVPCKGFDVLIEAWANLARDAGTYLVIVGSGPEAGRLKELAARRAVQSSVIFVPASPRSADYLAGADAVAVPSHFEGMSNVLLEAMVAGVPVVASRVSGNVDLLRNGENGLLVDVGDVAGLARALRRVLSEPGQLGRKGRETVLARCELGHVVDRYENVFRTATQA